MTERLAGSGVHDFDFLFGKWTSRQRRLVRPLAGCTDWYEFDATLESRAILGGRGNFDEFFALSEGIVGATLRLFDPERQEWSIYWMSNKTGALEPPVVGRFVDGRGLFDCDDTYDERPIRVRYMWSDITPTSARWEQLFSVDGGTTWESNWKAEFTRTSAPVS